MLRYLARRLGWAAILLVVLTLVTFVLSHVIPGDPATFMAGFGATKESIVAMRTEMGLDKPLPTQYLLYLQGLAHLDFGKSVRTGDAVSSDIAHFLPATLELAIISFTIYVLLAVPLGTLAASRRAPRLEGFFGTFRSRAPAFPCSGSPSSSRSFSLHTSIGCRLVGGWPSRPSRRRPFPASTHSKPPPPGPC